MNRHKLDIGAFAKTKRKEKCYIRFSDYILFYNGVYKGAKTHAALEILTPIDTKNASRK